jgi:hypothetical protein
VLADGAHWIWNLVEDLLPHAVQILDFSHVKHYLWEAAKLIYGADSAFVRPWVKEQENLLFTDQVAQVMTHLQWFVDIAPDLEPILHYFRYHQARMHYGTYRRRGYFIGSGAIESAGKQLTAARIKGAGMRWNVPDLNALLALRCNRTVGGKDYRAKSGGEVSGRSEGAGVLQMAAAQAAVK